MLRCAYLPDTGNDPVVLIWGSVVDLRWLGGLFQSLSVQPRLEVIGGDPTDIKLRITEGPCGMRRVDGALAWEMSRDDAASFSEMLESLAASPHPAHQYLDCASGVGVTVKVSLDEYPDDFRP